MQLLTALVLLLLRMFLSLMSHEELATLQGTPAQLGTLWKALPFVLVSLEDTGVRTKHIIAGVRGIL